MANEKQNATFTFYMGSTKIETSDINELKEFVSEIYEKTGKEELSGTITDFIFAVESAYQQFHDLDENNWDIVH